MRGLTRKLLAGLALTSALAPTARAQGVRAAGGVAIVEAVERSDLCVVGVTRNLRELDAKGYAAELVVEQPLGAGLAAGSVLSIAWEELASARPPRFASGDRVLVCLGPLPGSTLWLHRFPDPEQRREVLVVANLGGAFLRNPGPGVWTRSSTSRDSRRAIAPARTGRPGCWSSRRARSCRSPKTPWRGCARERRSRSSSLRIWRRS